jgi:hypothetical protein
MEVHMEKAIASEKPKQQRTRLRSPNYPITSLGQAIEQIRKIYKEEKRNFTDPPVILKHLGYTDGSGTGYRELSALKQYGLLEDRSGSVGLSNTAYVLMYAEQGSPEYANALRESALKPQIFSEMLSAYPDGLPSDATLRSFLIGKKGFNPAAVENFIRVFKETMELAKVQAGEYDSAHSPDTGAERERMETQIIGSQPQPGAKAAPSVHTFTWSLSIPRNVRAELRLYGGDFKIEDVQRLKKQIESLEAAFDESEEKKK